MGSMCEDSITIHWYTLTDVKEVGKQAASNGLMTHNKNVFLSFQLHYHWFQSHHKVLIRLCDNTHYLT